MKSHTLAYPVSWSASEKTPPWERLSEGPLWALGNQVSNDSLFGRAETSAFKLLWGDNPLPVQKARSALMSSLLAITHLSECVGAWLFAGGVRNETAASVFNAYIKWMKKHLQLLISLNAI